MEEEDEHSLFPLHAGWFHHDSEYQPLPEVQHSAQPLPSRPSSQLAELALAKTRFLNFAQQLDALQNTPIRKDILEYAAPGFKNERLRDEVLHFPLVLRNLELRIQKMRKTRKIKKNWGEDDLKILVWVVAKYCEQRDLADPQKQLDEADWATLASLIPGVTAESCRFKWLGLRKVTLARHSWSSEESALLRELVGRRTTPRHCSEIKDWKAISQQLYNLHTDPLKCYRNAKQCRQHWTCYLSPKLKKGPWTRAEDLKLFRFISNNRGGKRWSEIAKQFNGRTENALKNRFTLLIDKQRKLHRKSASQLELIQQFLDQTQFAEIIAPDCELEEQPQAPRYKAKDETQSTLQMRELDEEAMNEAEDAAAPPAPIRVERIALKDFESLGFEFWKTLQPGIIETNGQFRKMGRKETQSEQEEGLPHSGTLLEGVFAFNSFCLDEEDEIPLIGHN